MSPTHLIIHGHFYQPPRENPWTDTVAREKSAQPHHDWNRRIDAECYRPNAFARVVDESGRIDRIINNYEWISFNFGPTLLRWLEQHDSLTLRRIREADRSSAVRLNGHGNAIAQAYNHMIMPLANRRDRLTQIRWGLAVFRRQFEREPEAMWLPETAADHTTLDDLIDHEMRFAILAPQQAGRVRSVDEAGAPVGKWQDVREAKVDPTRPYLYRHRDGSGRSLALFFYDGPLAQKLAFGDAFEKTEHFMLAVDDARGKGGLVHAAADGETAGHHHPWGDRVIAHALTVEAPEQGYVVSNYAAYLHEHPPRWEAELDLGPKGEGSSWSCAHGVGRWIRDCGCRIGSRKGWNQEWRGPLREAFDLLRDTAAPWFEAEAASLLSSPWTARDEYIQVLLDPNEESRTAFLERHRCKPLGREEARRAFELLEMQHQLMLMYTSCGWFFDDVAGLESMQVLRYAGRALDMWAGLGGTPPGASFVEMLGEAVSNAGEHATAADLFRAIAVGETLAAPQIAAHAAMLPGGEDELARGGRVGSLAGHHYRLHSARRSDHEGTGMFFAAVELENQRSGARFEGELLLVETGLLGIHAVVIPKSSRDEGERGQALAAAVERSIGGGDLEDALRRMRGIDDAYHYDFESVLRSAGRELLVRATEARLADWAAGIHGNEPSLALGPWERVLVQQLRDGELDASDRLLRLAEVDGHDLDLHRVQEVFVRHVLDGGGSDLDDSAQIELVKRIGERLGFSSRITNGYSS